MKEITAGFIGNPNCGKTTVFNALTGANAHTGNWPGVTVEYKEGLLEWDSTLFRMVDLPGLYSIASYSYEETVTKNYLINNDVDVIVNIVDSSILSRSLYLTTQLMELQMPLVLVFNMTDIVESQNIEIDYAHIAGMLGAEYFVCSGNRRFDHDELLGAIKRAAFSQNLPNRVKYSSEMEHELAKLEAAAKPKDDLVTRKHNRIFIRTGSSKSPLRWYITRSLEGSAEDREVLRSSLEGAAGFFTLLDTARSHMEAIYRQDLKEVLTDDSYGFVEGIIQDTSVFPPGEQQNRTEKIDNILLNRFLGIPLFILIMYLIFTLTFKLGDIMAEWLSGYLDILSGYAAVYKNTMLRSFIVDGLISGVGGVLTFLPTIAIMLTAISLLEDSGYLSRAAFLSDRLMRCAGLHGKSFIPLLLGFGCNVPAVMATRAMESRADRIVTCLINPLISCSARIPIYVLFASIFFEPQVRPLVIMSIYAISIALALLMGKLFRKALFAHEDSHFVMELPAYRCPTIKGTAIHVWERIREFIIRAGTVIFLFSLVIWIFCYFPKNAGFAGPDSYMGRAGNAIAPILRPIGLDGNAGISLIFGIGAKEIVASTINILYGKDGSPDQKLRDAYPPISAYVFMLVSLIYFPCLATVITIKNEVKSWKYFLAAILYPPILAWLLGFVVFRLGSLF